MDFRPFVNQGGQRIVRWDRLVLVWAVLLVTPILAGAAVSSVLLGDCWRSAFEEICLGILAAVIVTVYGFTTPVENLPSVRHRPHNGWPEAQSTSDQGRSLKAGGEKARAGR